MYPKPQQRHMMEIEDFPCLVPPPLLSLWHDVAEAEASGLRQTVRETPSHSGRCSAG